MNESLQATAFFTMTRVFRWWFFRSNNGVLHFAGEDKHGGMFLSEPVVEARVVQRRRSEGPYVSIVVGERQSPSYQGLLTDSDGVFLVLPLETSKVRQKISVCEEQWFHAVMPVGEVCPYCKFKRR